MYTTIILGALLFVEVYRAGVETLNFMQTREMAKNQFYSDSACETGVEVPDQELLDIIRNQTMINQAITDFGFNETGVELIDDIDERIEEQRRRGY